MNVRFNKSVFFKYYLLSLMIFTVLSLYEVNQAQGEDWLHWRGSHQNGIVNETSGWNGKNWKLSKPVWKKNVGKGCTSPVVVGNNLYTLGWEKNRVKLVCLNTTFGKELWSQSFKCPEYGRHSKGDLGQYNGITGTPTYDKQTHFLYTLSTDGDLFCWDTRKKGNVVWKMNLYDKYKVPQRPNVGKRSRMHRDYGYTSSPLLYKQSLIVEVGDNEGTLMAFDKKTGKRLWKSQATDPAGHTGSPVFMEVEGVPCVAVLTIRNLLVVRLDKGNEGKTVATYQWTTDFANNIATPTLYKNEVLITSAYNHYAMCKVRVTLRGAKKIWEVDNPSGVCSPIIHNNKIYWAWRGIHCLDFKTGKEIWRGGKVGAIGSCIITKDNKLLTWADRGDLILTETDNKYKVLATQKRVLRKDVWCHIVLANGSLYCKDRDGNLVCLHVGK